MTGVAKNDDALSYPSILKGGIGYFIRKRQGLLKKIIKIVKLMSRSDKTLYEDWLNCIKLFPL